MKVSIKSFATGQEIDQVELKEEIFDAPSRDALVHEIIVAYQSRARQGSQKQKTRSEVSGGGKKPFKQKGTGRARAGSTRVPQWTGGGVTFARNNRDYTKKINKKARKAGICSIFSELIRSGRLCVVDAISVEEIKTKHLLSAVSQHTSSSALLIEDSPSESLYLSARNLHKVEVASLEAYSPVSLLKFDQVLISAGAIKKLEENLT